MLLFFGGVGMQELLIILPLFVLWIWGIVDVVNSNFKEDSTKLLWIIIILIAPLIGILLYLIIGRKQRLAKR